MKKSKNILYAILSFITPIIIFYVVLLINGIPHKKIFYSSDALKQYIPTFKYLYNVLHGNSSFPYTFSKGIGGTMYGAFFYGLSSPINFLVYFFKNIEFFYLIITYLKIGLSGLSMYIFLRHKKNKQVESLFFSFSYSLSGYIVLYYLNIMWLDAVWIAPLLLISIDKVIKERNFFLYVILLFYSLVSNYYTGYMLTLFSIIYYLYESYINYAKENFIKNNIKKISYFVLITFLTGSLISFILMPVFIEATNYTRVTLNTKILNFNFYDLFAGTYIGFGNSNKTLNYYGFLIYGGTIIIPLIIKYFTSKNISKKEKKASTIVILLFFIPIIFKPAEYIWHLFTYPIGFNYRYSFLCEIFLIYLATKGFNTKDYSKKTIYIYFILYTVLSVGLAYASQVEPEYYMNFLNIKKIVITLIFLLANIIIIIKNKHKLLYTFLIIELCLNILLIFDENKNIDRAIYFELDNIITNSSEIVKDDNNYRYETYETFNLNPSLYYDYKGISTFLSSSNANSYKTINKIYSINRKTNYISFFNSNILSDNLFSLKYTIHEFKNSEYKTLKTYNFDGTNYYLQQNNYALPIGYSASKKIMDVDFNNNKNIFLLEELYNKIINKEYKYFIKLDVSKTNKNEFIINNYTDNNTLYIISDELPINYKEYNLINTDKYIVCSDCKKKSITLKFEKEKKGIKAYALDIEQLKKFRAEINEFYIENLENNMISGKITATNNSILILTIPYEKGWKVYNNNIETTYFKVMNGLIGIKLNDGVNNIKLVYSTPGLELGITISLLGLISLIVLYLKKEKKSVLKTNPNVNSI